MIAYYVVCAHAAVAGNYYRMRASFLLFVGVGFGVMSVFRAP